MADDAELIKAGTQGLVEGTLAPFHQLILSLFGPAADEAGLILKEYVRHYGERQRRFFQRTQEVVSAAHIKPQPVALKLLKPIIENASIEDDDVLQDTWVNLLANAADHRDDKRVEAPFLNVLRELSARDVRFLDSLYDHLLSNNPPLYGRTLDKISYKTSMLQDLYAQAGLARYPNLTHITMGEIRTHGNEIDQDAGDFSYTMDVLTRNLLLTTWMSQPVDHSNVGEFTHYYAFTTFGLRFVKACKAPSGRSDGNEPDAP